MDQIQAAIADTSPDSLSADVLGTKPLSAEHIMDLIDRGSEDGGTMGEVARQAAPPQAPMTAPPPNHQYVPQHMQQPMHQAPPPPQQNQMSADMLMSQLAQERAERLAIQAERDRLAPEAANARQFTQWLAENEDFVRQYMEKGSIQDPNAPPPDPVQVLQSQIQQLQRKFEHQKEAERNTRFLSEQAIEAVTLAQKFGVAVDLNQLTEYARSRGIPSLKMALNQAAGELVIAQAEQALAAQRQQPNPPQQPSYTQYPQGYPQYPQGYPQQQQPQWGPPPAAPPQQPQAVVMSPGSSVPAAAPRESVPRTVAEYFNRIRANLPREARY